ncbi:MAG: phytoene desaturase family protein [Acidimicrobiales bacterium]
MADAVVVGAGHNGLVAANLLADAGWDVVVCEEQDTPGGAVASADYLGPGYVADVCSAFYPLAVASPHIQGLHLEDHGLEWCHAPSVLAHPLLDGRAAVISREPEETAAGLDALGQGDGDAWRRLCGLWDEIGHHLVRVVMDPFPPLRSGARLAGRLGLAGGLRFARFSLLPVRHLAAEELRGPGSLLIAGCALHTDLTPESAASSIYGWLLAMLGQQVGFPVPRGGAGKLAESLVRRLESGGGRIRCRSGVRSIVIRRGRAVGVVTSGGEVVKARRAVLADVAAPILYGGLVGWDQLPARLRDDMSRFEWDDATVKVDWVLKGGIPWTAEGARQAGTVHVSEDLDEMTAYGADLARGRVPARPFVLVGQMTTADRSRSPAGTEVVWGYSHVPREVRGDSGDGGIAGRWDEHEKEAFAARIEAQIERFAPGFRQRIVVRHILAPPDLQAHDASLVGGAINGGTAALHQQLMFRPTPGLGHPTTPIRGLYLASSSAHPGGGTHGACGAHAARAALNLEQGARRLFTVPAASAARRLAGQG